MITIVNFTQQSQNHIDKGQHHNFIGTHLLIGMYRSNSRLLVKMIVHPNAMKIKRPIKIESEIEWKNKYMKSKTP